jgi:hypothetical protein
MSLNLTIGSYLFIKNNFSALIIDILIKQNLYVFVMYGTSRS